MEKETQNSENCDDLFKSIMEELHPLTKYRLLLYYFEKDIIPIIEQMKADGTILAQTTTSQFIAKFEERKIPKKRKFDSWMVGSYGKYKQPDAKI